MKKLVLILFLTITTYMVGFTQTKNYIYHGDNKYEATQSWNFEINGTSWDTYLEITIGKDGNNGIIMLKTGVTPRSYIGGPIYIFLSDGSKITCTDKNIKDNVDNKSVVIYKLTADEVEKLKANYISSIRFTIQPASDGGFNGNKTADNNTHFNYNGNHYNTDQAVKELFDK